MEFVRSRYASFQALRPGLRAVVIMLVAIILASGMSVCIRNLGSAYSPFQIVFVRSVVMLSVLLPLLVRGGLALLATRKPLTILLRGLTGFMGQVFGVLAILNLPLAEVQAIGFTKGFIVALLSLLVLQEAISPRRWLAIGLCFSGVLIILQPQSGVNWAALYALGSATCFSVSTILVKRLLKTHSRRALMTHAALLQAGLSAIPALLVWTPPAMPDLIWFAGMGATALAVQPLNLAAFRLADVSALAPVDFFRIITASLVGYFVFAEVPGLSFWIGASIIVFANVLALREPSETSKERSEPTNPSNVI